jgi:hypothetical protein
MHTAATHPLPVPARGFVSRQPAASWEEGLLSANGTLALNALSRPHDERIIFSHERLFMPMGAPHVPLDQSQHLPEIRRLIAEEKYKEAEILQFTLSGQKGFQYPDFFVPAFDLRIVQPTVGEIRDYARSVDFESAEVVVHWTDDRGTFERRQFVSRHAGVAVILLTAGKPGTLDATLRLEAREPSDEYNNDSDILCTSDEMFHRQIGDVRSTSGPDWLGFGARFLNAYPGSIQSIVGRARVIVDGGTTEALAEGSLDVRSANRVLLFVDLGLPSAKDPRGMEHLEQKLAGIAADYPALLEAHAPLHGDLFRRVKLDLGGGADHLKSTEQLMAESGFDEMNLAWLEKQFDAGRYNIICATGELSPSLQGIWGGTYVPGWAGDYTHNGNVQSSIAANFMANTPELMLPYFDYLESLVPMLEHNARAYFGCRGILLPSRTSTHGYNNALCDTFAGGMWTAGAAWAAHYYYDYFLYTQDEHFLATRVLPFMENVAAFFEDFLFEGPDGRLVFSPAQSPENTPANSDSQATFNATMDVAVVKELLGNLIAASRRLGKNEALIPIWETLLAKMPEYAVEESGIVKEWLTPKLQNQDAHRHSSQLIALYDGLPDEIDQSPHLRRAFLLSIEDKLERYWKDNKRGFMSFGIVQLGQVAASLGLGDLAHHCLKHLVDGFWLSNLASMHNRRALLNMDISGGQPSVVIKMLVDSFPGKIRLLPALPSAWPTGTLEGARCRGAITVERLHWREERVGCTLRATTDQTFLLILPRAIAAIECEGATAMECDLPNARRLTLKAGNRATVNILLDIL